MPGASPRVTRRCSVDLRRSPVAPVDQPDGKPVPAGISARAPSSDSNASPTAAHLPFQQPPARKQRERAPSNGPLAIAAPRSVRLRALREDSATVSVSLSLRREYAAQTRVSPHLRRPRTVRARRVHAGRLRLGESCFPPGQAPPFFPTGVTDACVRAARVTARTTTRSPHAGRLQRPPPASGSSQASRFCTSTGKSALSGRLLSCTSKPTTAARRAPSSVGQGQQRTRRPLAARAFRPKAALAERMATSVKQQVAGRSRAPLSPAAARGAQDSVSLHGLARREFQALRARRVHGPESAPVSGSVSGSAPS